MKHLKKFDSSNQEPIKFYYIWQYVEWGGAQILLLSLMKEAKKNGQVQAVIPANTNSQLIKFLNHLKITSTFFEGQTDVKPAKNLVRKIQRHWNKFSFEIWLIWYLRKFDFTNSIIHTEFAPWQSMIILWWMCQKAPVFVTMHNSLPINSKLRTISWKLKFNILTLSKNFHLFTANIDTKNSLQTLVSRDFLEKVTVTYASINPDEISEALNSPIDRSELKEKYNLPKNKFLVFCVGQFIDRKGRWIFLEAAQKLSSKNDDIAFVWISNSKPSSEEFRKAESYNLGENFIFLSSDQIGDEHVDLFKLLRLADVFALPSYLEGLPISIIEAMALGIPTISTKINAIPEAVKHLETGILIEPGNSNELAAAIQNLKDDDQLRRNLSENGRRHALATFDEKNIARIAVKSYLDALKNSNNGARE